MIAVTFALPIESSKFTRLLDERATDTNDVRVVHTGVGEAACKRSMRAFLAVHSPRLLISSGFAGALTNELGVGDLLLAQNFTSAEWLERARNALNANARIGSLATASAIIDEQHARDGLARRAGAIAVDMETQFIAEACHDASIPLIALRAISDTPARPMPAPPHVLFDVAAQKTKAGTLALHLATHPRSLPRLIGFARQIATTRDRLTNALAALVQDLDVSHRQ